MLTSVYRHLEAKTRVGVGASFYCCIAMSVKLSSIIPA